MSLFLLAASACDKGPKPAGKGKTKPNTAAEPAAAKVDANQPSSPEPATPEPAAAEPTLPTASAAGAGFVVGAALPINDDLDGMLEIEAAEPQTHAGATVIVGSHAELDGENNMSLALRARVEFAGVDASAGLNHEQPSKSSFAERVFPAIHEIAKLPDGRWLVDAQLSAVAGEDSLSSTTDHAVILVDPAKRSAAVLWSGADSSLSDGGGACETATEHGFAVDGEELVVSKTAYTEFDPEIAEEMGISAEDCKSTPRARAEVARVGLAGK